MELQLTIEQTKALLVIAPKSDTRYYYNGALLEVKDDRAWLVATDGHRMLVIRPTARIEGKDVRDGRWIIPRDLLAGAKVKKGGFLFLSVDQYQGEKEPYLHCARARIITGTGELSAPTVDAMFPDWRRVVPAKASGELAHYDPTYVGDFGTVAELLSGARINARIYYNGEGAAPVDLGVEDALGVLMPIRAEQRPYARPDWTR
jgi:DNA polymerase-3 subunit beta